jgi:3-methyladenine DNA glycosylase AlkD
LGRDELSGYDVRVELVDRTSRLENELMTAQDLVEELRGLGSASIKKVLMNHGAREPFFGVKVGDLKPIQKRIKMNYELSLDLYDTGISDAMYLAGLIADDAKMTKKDLNKWVKGAYWYMISEYTVPWVASGSKHGHEIAREWIDQKAESTASAGWCTWSSMLSVKPDAEFDEDEIKRLLKRVETTIHGEQNRVRYSMNGFVIAVGTYFPALKDQAVATAKKVGVVSVNLGDTACKVPDAIESMEKVFARGPVKKKKTPKC